MAKLTSQSIKDTYKDMVHLFDGSTSTGQGFESAVKTLYDGEGNAGPVAMSSTTLSIPSGKTLSLESGSSLTGTFTDLGLPSQTSNSGKFLKTNGSVSSWDTVDTEITALGTLTGATPLVFEGATDNAYELTIAITDPLADHTITLPNLTGTVSLKTASETLTNKTLTSPKINEIIFEGATADDYETTLGVVDPTADRTITFPNSSGTVALEGTFAAVGVNTDITQMTGLGATPFVFEGATADAHETSIAVTDPTADRTITFPDATGTVITTGNLTSINGVLGAGIRSTSYASTPKLQVWDGSLAYLTALSYGGAANLVKLGTTVTDPAGVDHCDVLIDTGTTLLVKGTLQTGTIADPESPPGVVEGGMYSDGENFFFGSTTD